jgi:hypothetical protein
MINDPTPKLKVSKNLKENVSIIEIENIFN